MYSKKGIGDLFVLMFSGLVLVFFLILMIYISNFSESQESQDEFLESVYEKDLLLYLRLPASEIDQDYTSMTFLDYAYSNFDNIKEMIDSDRGIFQNALNPQDISAENIDESDRDYYEFYEISSGIIENICSDYVNENSIKDTNGCYVEFRHANDEQVLQLPAFYANYR